VTYDEFVTLEAIKINSDKCTFATDWNVWCCYEHDLACHYAKDPRDAFERARAGYPNYWQVAKELRRKDADKRFWQCNRAKAPSLAGRLRSDVRYLGVRLGALWPF
jgi:hypothetical protein